MEEVKNEQNKDELYAKIETEKLLKAKKKKNVFMIVFLSVIFALAVVIICLGSIPMSLKPSFLSGTYNVNVSINGKSVTGEITPTVDDESNAEYNEFVELLNSAFNQTYFSALFNGSLSTSNPIESKTNTLDYFKTNVLNNAAGSVEFGFSEIQTIKDGNGNDYSSVLNLNAVPFTFDVAYLVLKEEGGIQDTSFYVVVQYLDSEGKELNNYKGEYVIELQTKADTSKIIDHYNPDAE